MFEAARSVDQYLAVIDIGSNSVRLVVFSGRKRVPDTVFNEKIMCGLGAEVGATGRMGEDAIEMAISTMKRFRALCEQMEVGEILCVATAAVRDADNGAAFVRRVKKECGLDISVIDGIEEGRLSGLGVLSADPSARGIMGDLGGGSLELAHLDHGEVLETISLPLGPLRLQSRFGHDRTKIRKHLRDLFAEIPWLEGCDGKNFYMVGGAWRNIAKIMMKEKSYPLAILHGFSNSKTEFHNFCDHLSRLKPEDIPYGDTIPERRRDVLPTAALVVMELLDAMKAKTAVISSYGLREGLIFDAIDAEQRTFDPFLYYCHVLADERCRFAEHADLIYDWTRPLFPKASANETLRHRLHLGICLLGDIAWRGHPDFRAERAVETVLHGNYVGATHKDRAFLAVAMNQAYGAPNNAPHIAPVLPLLKVGDILEAQVMGAALRLAQRLSGGTVPALKMSRLKMTKKDLSLAVPRKYRDLANDVVYRRLNQLAQLLGRNAVLEFKKNPPEAEKAA